MVLSFGEARKVLTPSKIKKIPPNNLSQTAWLIRKYVITVRLKAAIVPYKASAVAAPKPDTKPALRPWASVRRMQSIPIGPTGAAMVSPIRKLWIRIDKYNY